VDEAASRLWRKHDRFRRVRREFLGSGRKLVDLQDECDDVDITLVAQAVAAAKRHRVAYPLEAFGERLSHPLGLECRAGQVGRFGIRRVKVAPMTSGTARLVRVFSSLGLSGGEDPAPD